MNNINSKGEVGRFNQGGWVNEEGVPVPESQLDLGDGTQRTGMTLWGMEQTSHPLLETMKQQYVSNIENLRGPCGMYRRATTDKVDMWYNDLDRMSRDQATGLLVGLAVTGQRKEILRFILGHALRLFLFTTNVRRNGTTRLNHGKPFGSNETRNYNVKLPDLTGPDFWALELRALFKDSKLGSLLIPLLTVLDLDILLSVVLFNMSKSDSNVVDNLTLKLSFFNKVLPSPLSKLAYKLVNKEKLKTKLTKFFSNDGDPKFIADIYQELF